MFADDKRLVATAVAAAAVAVGGWGGTKGPVICFWVSRKCSLSPVADGNSLSAWLHLICVVRGVGG